MKSKLQKVIIDTDPGVDDTAALALSLYDDVMDIIMVTTVNGNLDVATVTRNALHILDKFNRTDIPVYMGASKAINREPKDAKFIHQQEGMGGYIPPKQAKSKVKDGDAVEAMYSALKQYPKEISIIALGPHTNLGLLLSRHPDASGLIKHIYCEGCAPYGLKTEGGKWVNYISFNISSDPEAFDIVLKSGVPLTIIPSRMGRELANFTEQEVDYLKDINSVGKFLYEIYSGYWEPGYEDRRIATNDTCAVLSMRKPKLFKFKKCNITVDTNEFPGKTSMEFTRKGKIKYAYKVNRNKMHKFYFNAVKKLDNFKF